jgi:hypothetical protein
MKSDLHRRAKLEAYRKGKNLQDWLASLIEFELNKVKIEFEKLCQECGKWDLTYTRIAHLDKCQKCGKIEIPVFSCRKND